MNTTRVIDRSIRGYKRISVTELAEKMGLLPGFFLPAERRAIAAKPALIARFRSTA